MGPPAFAHSIHDEICRIKAEVERELPGQLDWTAWYVDDGVMAGTTPAIHLFYSKATEAFAQVGLTVTPDKCELIPAGGARFREVPGTLLGVPRNLTGNFKLLGAPFGDAAYSLNLTTKRVAKVKTVLDDQEGG